MSNIVTNPDGTSLHQSQESTIQPSLVPLQASAYLDDFTALQVGLWRILSAVRIYSIDRTALVEKGVVEKREFSVDRVYFDWPDSEDSMMATDAEGPSVLISAGSESDLQLLGPLSGQRILEHTLDQFGPGTVLRRLFDANTELLVQALFTNKDDRAAARKAFISAFAGEPTAERSGRRVIIPEYFGAQAKYDLVGVSYQDGSETAQRKQFPLVLQIAASIQVVELVAAPAELKPTMILEYMEDDPECD